MSGFCFDVFLDEILLAGLLFGGVGAHGVLGFLAVDVGVGVGVVGVITECPVVGGVGDEVDHAHCLCLPHFLESDCLVVAVVPKFEGVGDGAVICVFVP